MGYGKVLIYLGAALFMASGALGMMSEMGYVVSGYQFMDVFSMWPVWIIAVVLIVCGIVLMRRETRFLRR